MKFGEIEHKNSIKVPKCFYFLNGPKIKEMILLNKIIKNRCGINLIISLTFAIILIFLSIFTDISTVSANDSAENYSISEDMLMVGMIDLTLLFNDLSANIKDIDIGDEFKENIVVNGRTAFFLKGKIKGKYLITVKLDTGQGEINDIWEGLFSQNTDNTISRIDPDKYYPIYGDDSSVINMVDSQGKLYLDLAWDNTEMLWGNYRININDKRLLNYNRSLYGFTFKTELKEYNSQDENMDIDSKGKEDGLNRDKEEQLEGDRQKNSEKMDINKTDSQTRIMGFWSKPESVHTYNELEMTGGMLYYLKYGNLLIGTEKIKVEIRDNLTGEIEESKELTVGLDYKIDYLSGRIILINNASGIEYLYDEEDEQSAYLIANYEYEPIEDIDKQSSYGFNLVAEEKGAKISGTYTTETTAAGKRYISKGIAYNYQNNNSNTILEWANSQNQLANQYFSEDGGMTYNLINTTADVDSANAYLVQYETNLNDINSSFPGVDINVVYSHKDKGFSNQQKGIEEDTDSLNLELTGGNEQTSYTTRYYWERKNDSGKTDIIDLKVTNKVNDKLKLSGQLRQKDINQHNQLNSQLSTEIDFRYQLDKDKEIYGSQELSLKGDKINNTTLGAKIKPRDNITLDAAITMDNSSHTEDRDTLKLGGSYHHEYGEVYSAFVTKGSGNNSMLLGGNTAINDNTDLYIEQKTTNNVDEDSKSNILGIKHDINDKWSLALDYSRSNVIKEDDTEVNRDIITPAIVYRDEDMTYKAKMEYRRDLGEENLKQYVLTSGIDMAYNQELSVLFNLDYSLTERDNDIDKKDSFTEAQFGLAYRPIEIDRLNLLAMYTYQEEYKPEDQENRAEYNERSNIFSIEGIYDLNARWQLGEKLAWKNSQLISDDIDVSSDTYLWINRLCYKGVDDWDIYGEYRILENKQAEDRKSGLLLGVNKKLNDTLKLGVGYNFTDFNDDLTDLDYRHRGLFINLVKSW